MAFVWFLESYACSIIMKYMEAFQLTLLFFFIGTVLLFSFVLVTAQIKYRSKKAILATNKCTIKPSVKIIWELWVGLDNCLWDVDLFTSAIRWHFLKSDLGRR